jgi:hypothetical protein
MSTWLGKITPFLGVIVLAVAATSAKAQTLVGRVVNSNGVGVAGVNIDALDQGGNDVPLSHDGTDANGNFAVDFPSNGTYDVFFYPMVSSHYAPTFRDDVVVSGTTNIGNITVLTGVIVQGRSVDGNLSPIDGAKIKMRDNATQQFVLMSQDKTDANGNFANVVVAGNYDIEINTETSDRPDLAPKGFFDVNYLVDTNLGNIIHPPGFHVTAHVQRSNGTPVVAADFDFTEASTGEKQYTPGDDTDANGNIDTVVKAGTFNIEVDAQISDKLVSKLLTNVVINGTTNLGTIVLSPGFYLQGTVTDSRNVKIADVNLDVDIAGTSTEIPMDGDHTDGNGAYRVVVPAGTYDLYYKPPVTLPLQTVIIFSRTINADTTIDVVLPDCPAPSHYGSGTPGSGGFTPQLGVTGAIRLGNTITLDITQGLGGAQAFLLIGLAPANIQGSGWTLLVSPGPGFTVISFKLGGTPGVPGVGSSHLPGHLPSDPIFNGLNVYMQVATLDPGASKGVAATDGLHIVLCR